jgi:hypothetical protein
MSALATRSELEKLARTLDVELAEVSFLEDLPADQLRGFRASIYELIFSDDRELFALIAAWIRRLPPAAAARVAQRTGPLITARVATETPAGWASEVAARLPVPFIADACLYLDPRRTQDLLRRFPTELVVALARELADREDYMTISRFVEFFPDAAVAAVIEGVEDERVLLQVAFYMGAKNRVDHLFRLLSPGRIERLMVSVEDESPELLPQLLSLLIHTGYRLKRELGDLAAAQDPSVLTGYIRATHDQRLWGDMLPVVASMSDGAREKVVNLPVLREEAIQAGILEAADAHRLWGLVLPLIARMDDDNQAAVARIMAARPEGTIARAAEAALMGEQWEPLLDLVRRMPEERQAELMAVLAELGAVDPDLRDRVSGSARAAGFAAAAG